MLIRYSWHRQRGAFKPLYRWFDYPFYVDALGVRGRSQIEEELFVITRTWKEVTPILAGRVYAVMQPKDIGVAVNKVKQIRQRIKEDPNLYQRLQRHSDVEQVLTTAAVILYSAGTGPTESRDKSLADVISIAGDLLHEGDNFGELTEITATIYAAQTGPGVNDTNQIKNAREAAERLFKAT